MKYFFFDIDGTLSYWNKSLRENVCIIPESTKLAIKKLKEEGHFLAIATGRSYPLAKKFLDELDFDNMVTDGGYGIVLNKELISVEPLNKQDCLGLINECEEKGFPWSFSPEIAPIRYAPNDSFVNTTNDRYIKTQTVEGLNPADYEKIYKVYVACKAPDEEKLKYINIVPWCRYHDNYIFFEPCDKSFGIKKIVDYYGGNYKDVVVFGDEKNDISMFQDDWTKVAMGNGCEEVKNLADYVTDDVDKDGIYKACLRFGWIKE